MALISRSRRAAAGAQVKAQQAHTHSQAAADNRPKASKPGKPTTKLAQHLDLYADALRGGSEVPREIRCDDQECESDGHHPSVVKTARIAQAVKRSLTADEARSTIERSLRQLPEEIKLTAYNTSKATTQKHLLAQVRGSWDDMVLWHQTTISKVWQYVGKDKILWPMVPGTPRQGVKSGIRQDKHTASREWLIVENDGPGDDQTIQSVHKTLSGIGIAHIIHASRSRKPGKWHLKIPLASPITYMGIEAEGGLVTSHEETQRNKREYSAILGVFASLIGSKSFHPGGGVDPTVSALQNQFYLPLRDKDQEPVAIYSNSGKALDWKSLLEEIGYEDMRALRAIEADTSTKATTERHKIRNYKPIERVGALQPLGMALFRAGLLLGVNSDGNYTMHCPNPQCKEQRARPVARYLIKSDYIYCAHRNTCGKLFSPKLGGSQQTAIGMLPESVGRYYEEALRAKHADILAKRKKRFEGAEETKKSDAPRKQEIAEAVARSLPATQVWLQAINPTSADRAQLVSSIADTVARVPTKGDPTPWVEAAWVLAFTSKIARASALNTVRLATIDPKDGGTYPMGKRVARLVGARAAITLALALSEDLHVCASDIMSFLVPRLIEDERMFAYKTGNDIGEKWLKRALICLKLTDRATHAETGEDLGERTMVCGSRICTWCYPNAAINEIKLIKSGWRTADGEEIEAWPDDNGYKIIKISGLTKQQADSIRKDLVRTKLDMTWRLFADGPNCGLLAVSRAQNMSLYAAIARHTPGATYWSDNNASRMKVTNELLWASMTVHAEAVDLLMNQDRQGLIDYAKRWKRTCLRRTNKAAKSWNVPWPTPHDMKISYEASRDEAPWRAALRNKERVNFSLTSVEANLILHTQRFPHGPDQAAEIYNVNRRRIKDHAKRMALEDEIHPEEIERRARAPT